MCHYLGVENGGRIGAYMILGGVDIHGPKLCYIHAHGNTANLPFTAMGSGSTNAIAVLESRYKDDLTVRKGYGLWW